MTREGMKYAIWESRRFIERAQAALREKEKEGLWIGPSKESGAARRVSMDLTRALAEMRRPPK